MPLNVKDSMDNPLVNITQEQADIWHENQKKGKVPVKEFSDYSREGLISLITAFCISESKEEEKEVAK